MVVHACYVNMEKSDDIFDDLCKNLQLIIDEIKEEESAAECGAGTEDFCLQTFWTNLNAGMQSMSGAATRLCLSFSPQPLTTAEEARPLLMDIERSALAIVSTYSVLPLSRGKTLRRAVAASVLGMIVAAQSLIQSISSQLCANKSTAQQQTKKSKKGCSTHLQMTGLTWDYANKFSDLPPDNGVAVSLKAKECLGLISDAVEEIEETLADSSGSTHNDDDDDETIDDDDEMISQRWSDADRNLARACTQLIKAAKSCAKKIVTLAPLSEDQAAAAAAAAAAGAEIAAVDELAEQLSAVSPASDELIESLYPPVNIPTVRLHCEQLCQCLLSTLSAVRVLLQVRQQQEQQQQQWVEFLEKAVDHNKQKIYSLIDSMHSHS